MYLVKFVEGNGKVCLKCGVSFFFMHFNVIFQCRMYLIGIMWMHFNSNNFGSWSRENTVLLESRYLCINIEIFNVTYGIDAAAYLDNGCLILRNFTRSSQCIFFRKWLCLNRLTLFRLPGFHYKSKPRMFCPMCSGHMEMFVLFCWWGERLKACEVLERVATSLLAFTVKWPFPIPWQSMMRFGLQHSIVCVGMGQIVYHLCIVEPFSCTDKKFQTFTIGHAV